MAEADAVRNRRELHELLVGAVAVVFAAALHEHLGAAGEHVEAAVLGVDDQRARLHREATQLAAAFGILERVDALGQRDHEAFDRLLGGRIVGEARVDGALLRQRAHADAYRSDASRTERPPEGEQKQPERVSARRPRKPGAVAIPPVLAQPHRVHCFTCNAAVELGPGERIGFQDSCEGCGTDLHVCRNCAHHDASAYNECHEPNAERVSGRDRSNRCEYFTPGEGKGGGPAQEQARARSQLDGLFKKV